MGDVCWSAIKPDVLFSSVSTYMHGVSDIGKDLIQSILLYFSNTKNGKIKSITGTSQLLCCKVDENTFQSNVTHNSFIKTFDSCCLLSPRHFHLCGQNYLYHYVVFKIMTS